MSMNYIISTDRRAMAKFIDLFGRWIVVQLRSATAGGGGGVVT